MSQPSIPPRPISTTHCRFEGNQLSPPIAERFHCQPPTSPVRNRPTDTVHSAAENPFSASRVRPGAIDFRFPPGDCLTSVIERLRESGWRGQIVGPHGSGKSTLLAALVGELSRNGPSAVCVELHDRQRRLPEEFDLTRLAAGTLVIVDGYEQLSLWSRLRLKAACRRRRLGLLATAHRDVGLPTLISTTTSMAIAQEVVRELLADRNCSIATEQIAARFARHQGNLREVLFDLYDLYEQCRALDE